MNNWMMDLRYAIRSLAKSPGYAATVVLTLAIGICANATVFSWIRSVLLNPLPGVPASDRVVTIETLTPSGEMIDNSYADYRDFRDQSKLLTGMFAFKERPLSLGLGRESELVWSLMVSGNYFDALGLQPAQGRFFSKDEQAEVPGAARAIVLGHRFWERRFAANPAVVGQKIRLNKQEFTVIGVAPPGFSGTIGGVRFEVYVPMMMAAELTGNGRWLENRGSRGLYLMARLQDDVSIDQARAEIRTLAASLAKQYPDASRDHSATLLPVAEATRGAQSVLGAPLKILMAVAVVVLLIVCANVANLQLARAIGRRREIAVRHALGASRGRVGAMVLTESLLLSLAGGVAGVLLSLWTVDFLRVLLPVGYLPLYLALGADWTVLLFVALLCVLTALLAGTAPVLQSGKNLQAALVSGGRSASSASATGRLRNSLVIAEIALAMVALVSAGMLYRSFQNARSANPGFEPNGILLAGMNLSAGGYDRDQGLAFFQRLRLRLEAMPGVEGVAFAEDVPLGLDGGSWEELEIDGYVPAPNENMKIYRNKVTPGYLKLMRIPLLSGRDFTDRDNRQSPRVAIINETFARRYFAGRDPLNRIFRGWGNELQIIGVAADSKYASLREPAKPYFYIPIEQFYNADTGVALQVRAAGGDVRGVTAAVRGEIQALDGSVLSSLMLPLTEYMSTSYLVERTAALVLSGLGAVAMVLAVLGLFSAMAYAVSQRTPEMGIRLALGAQPIEILSMVTAQGLRLCVAGIAVGVAGAIAAGRLLSGILYGVEAVDPPSLIAASVLLMIVAAVAAYLPARRAASVDPLVALRNE